MVRHWTLTPAFQGSNPCSPVRIAGRVVSAVFFLEDQQSAIIHRKTYGGLSCEYDLVSNTLL